MPKVIYCICQPKKKLGCQAKIWGGMTHPGPPLELPLGVVCLCNDYFGRFKRWEYTKLNITDFSRWACEIAAKISCVTILATSALTP